GANAPRAFHQVVKLGAGRPPRGLRKTAIGTDAQALGRNVPQAFADAPLDFLWRLEVVTLYVNQPDADVHSLRDLRGELELGECAAGHLEVHLLDMQAEEPGEHRSISAPRHCPALVVAEAEVRAQVAPSAHRLDRAVERLDEPIQVFAIGVAAHRRLV